ncbi:hypothetical protein ACPV5U_19200 [Vibrio mediterranei]
MKFDGYINTASLKERFEQAPLVECYGVRFGDSDSYYMVIPIDGKRIVLSTWRSEVKKPFRRADSLIKEAESFGFTSIKFGSFEEESIAFEVKSNVVVANKFSALKYCLSLFPALGIKLKIKRQDFDNSKIDDGIDSYFRSESEGEKVLICDLIKGNVEVE